MNKKLTQLGQDLLFLAEVTADIRQKHNMFISAASVENGDHISVVNELNGELKTILIWENGKVDVPSEYYE